MAVDNLRAKILNFLAEHSQRTYPVKDLFLHLGLQPEDRDMLRRELKQMVAEGLLVKIDRSYGLPERLGYHAGVLQGHRRGYAFLRPDNREEDIFIRAANLQSAVHGDRVVVRLTGGRSKRRRREGVVIGILKRGSSRLVGTLQQQGKRFYVVPDDSRYSFIVQVPRPAGLYSPGDKVVVELRHWPRGIQPAQGRLVERFGAAGSRQAEALILQHKFDLPGAFPPAVFNELAELPDEELISRVAAEENRLDLTALTMVTIDDETARDFDDAVSLEPAEKVGFRLGVHIADVAQYVREGKALDREALKRATSIYLVDRVIHMLPPLLSENLCSLQAGKERLALSVFINLAANGEVLSSSFHPSLIKVAERLTYRQVAAFLEDEASAPFEHAAVGPMIREMDRLAAMLRQRRMKRGSLDLDMPEARIILDETGAPVEIERRRMGRAERLIEEFMILCNEVVADYFFKEKVPFIYRVHAVPAVEKLAVLRETLAQMGNSAVAGLKILKPKHLNLLLQRSRGERTEGLIRYLILRSLPQAHYSVENEGHFGLASRCYCHSTAPIRRYPDLVIHRILKEYLLRGGLLPKRVERLQSRLPAIALHASERERVAMEAERASMDQKKAEYMEGRLGEVYSGIISGVTSFGIFVELENTIEGMIPVADLGDDYYVYQEKQVALVGERTRKSFRLGDPLAVQVVRVNSAEGKITFTLA